MIDQFDQKTIRDRGAFTVQDLLQYAPNTIPGERGTVRIRGFDVGQSAASGGQLFDGVRSSVYNLIPTNLYNVGRVEILKGPAGVMYGANLASSASPLPPALPVMLRSTTSVGTTNAPRALARAAKSSAGAASVKR